MAKLKVMFICSNCGSKCPRWLGKCPECGSFNTLEEEVVSVNSSSAVVSEETLSVKEIKAINSIEPMSHQRMATKINELDRVLSGGIVYGSLVLLGGDPGIGKSTLLLQICQSIAGQGKTVLYASGEESAHQIKLRADRLKVTANNLYLIAQTNISVIEQAIRQLNPSLVIIDSIQTMHREEIASAPGSVSQVRECTSFFMKIAKTLNVSIVIVGHVTKEGAIAGPKILEHMVDTVLYFEGERKEFYRIIRATKNRFGATNEIGVFEMKYDGLSEILNPSEYMLSGRPLAASGSIVTCSLEGTRPILVEVQALVTYTNYGYARRVSTGIDQNRMSMLIAVLEKKVGMELSTYDSYVNIAGGLKMAEPSLDAAVVAVIASSFRNKIINPFTLTFGEIGLTGEMRAVTMAEARVLEAKKMGFEKCILPKANLKAVQNIKGIELVGVSSVSELLSQLFS